ncbi:MAG TPA: LuxR family transcriptional regulator [bacterium]
MDPSAEILLFALEKCPLGVLVFRADLRVAYCNARAARFLEHHALPAEVQVICRNMFRALADGSFAERFPGQVCLSREIGQAARRWMFRFTHRPGPPPLVCVYLFEITASSQIDLNVARQDYRLTRREADLVQHVLDGEKNQDIAAELGISEQTVKDHLSSVYEKVGVKNRVALVRLLMTSCHR